MICNTTSGGFGPDTQYGQLKWEFSEMQTLSDDAFQQIIGFYKGLSSWEISTHAYSNGTSQSIGFSAPPPLPEFKLGKNIMYLKTQE